MDRPSPYASCKKETRYLLYWMIRASDEVIHTLLPPETAILRINTSGVATTSDLQIMCQLVKRHAKEIPNTVFRLFKSVILSRVRIQSIFKLTTARSWDADWERRKDDHQRLVTGLIEAFAYLGGPEWELEAGNESLTPVDVEDIERDIFARPISIAGTRPDRPVKGATKAGLKRQKARKRVPLEIIPLEKFQIIPDFYGDEPPQASTSLDYLLALIDLFATIACLRARVQSEWRQVVYESLNSAVAAAVTSTAVAMVGKAAAEVSTEFSASNSFSVAISTITRDDPGKFQKVSELALQCLHDDMNYEAGREVDVREQLLIHTYKDLCDFLRDFQVHRSGRPTGRMIRELGTWDPDLDLQNATAQTRLAWRRAFTINWLYDAVVFYGRMGHRTGRKKDETLDSEADPLRWARCFDKATQLPSFVLSLAFIKPGTDFRPAILSQHVFELQCIVDSMTVSRGWSLDRFGEHVIAPPNPSYSSFRETQAFVSADPSRGFLSGVENVSNLLRMAQLTELGKMTRGLSELHELDDLNICANLCSDVRDHSTLRVGLRRPGFGTGGIPPSRFADETKFGIFYYVPYTSGQQLLLSLELAYNLALAIWDRYSEVACYAHMNNKLMEMGYISGFVLPLSVVDLRLAKEVFGPEGYPTTDFGDAFLSTHRSERSQPRKAVKTTAPKGVFSSLELLDPDANRVFKTRSYLQVLRCANFDIDAIPDLDVPLHCGLTFARLVQDKTRRDRLTGAKLLAYNEFTYRARCKMPVNHFHFLNSEADNYDRDLIDMSYQSSVPQGYVTKPAERTMMAEGKVDYQLLLTLVKQDLHSNICGDVPILGMDHMLAIGTAYRFFDLFKPQTDESSPPDWISRLGLKYQILRRSQLLPSLLDETDDKVCRGMAVHMWNESDGSDNVTYWGANESTENRMTRGLHHAKEASQCIVM